MTLNPDLTEAHGECQRRRPLPVAVFVGTADERLWQVTPDAIGEAEGKPAL